MALALLRWGVPGRIRSGPFAIGVNRLESPMSKHVGAIFQHHSEVRPTATALLGSDRRPLTYAELQTQIQYVVNTLNGCGIGRNDRVAVVLPNGPEMATAFLSVTACATSAPLNPGYRAEEFNFYLEDLRASAVIVDASARTVARDVARQRRIPVIELHPNAETAGRFTLSHTSDLPPKLSGFAAPEDVALVLHTSGTTARPKIVPLRHSNICASASQISASLGLTDSDRCLNVMPLFHIHGLIGALLSSLEAGGSVFCSPGLDAKSFTGWLDQSGSTWYTAVPTMHHMVMQEAGLGRGLRYQRSRLRFIRSCSSPLPPSLMADLEATFEVPVVEAYGMTEGAHQIAVNPLPPRARKPGSVGCATGTEIAILDTAGTLLLKGVSGEIAIRGESVMSGYAANPDENAKAFTDGWFRTGDQGHIDADGYLFITGRLKELINRGGEKIAPREVDEILLLHPAVAECVTFAAPHPLLGEEVAAAVVLRPGSHATSPQLQEFVAAHVSEFKVPRRVVILQELPKGPTGKLQRVGTAERLGITFHPSEQSERTLVEPVNEQEASLATTMAQILKVPRVGTTDNFFDRGGTSLHAAEFVCEVKTRYGWRLTLAHLYRRPNVKKLAQLLPTLGTTESLQLEDPERSVLRFNESGTLPALFFLHGSVEAAACGAELAAECGPDQPIFVLPAHGANGEPIPPTIEQMAAESLTTVRSLRANGPYVLTGFCRSAPVALELARQIQQTGEEVSALVVIDSQIENTNPAMLWLRRMIRLEGALRGWDARARLERFLTLKRLAERIIKRTGADPLSTEPRSARADVDAIGACYQKARQGYVPGRYSGRVVLLKPVGSAFDVRWRKVAPDLRLGDLPGTHMTCLTAHLPTVCSHLKSALNDASAECRRPLTGRGALPLFGGTT